jgi:hypothetical protein
MDGVNSSFFTTTDQKGLSYPFIQSTIYLPATYTAKQIQKMDESDYVQVGDKFYARPRLAMSVEGADLLCPEAAEKLALEPEEFQFENETSILFVLPPAARAVILCQPRVYKQSKADGKITPLAKGDKLKELNSVTVAKLFLALESEGELLLEADGKPQIFTLKLKSSKTALIQSRDPEKKTIAKLNQAIVEHYKAPRNSWATHLVSVKLDVVPEVFTGEGNSTVGVMFTIADPKPLTPESQALTHELVSSLAFKQLADDPFGLRAEKAEEQPPMPVAQPDSMEIPF